MGQKQNTVTKPVPTISASVAKKLGYYVYLYINPLDETIFYVGKGKGTRALAHLGDQDKEAVAHIIREIQASGEEPRIEILVHGLPDSETALRVEAAAIDLIDVANLANKVRGWRGARFGRMPLDELIAHYSHRKATIIEPSILVRINKLYHYGMTDGELYDATRSAWKVGMKREHAELAFCVYQGVVREVYRITGWLPAGSTFNARRGGRGFSEPSRWEFIGVIAEDAIRERYRNRYVGHYFTQGAQNPIKYVNIE
ncbi:MAG: hypothetical protein ACE5G0_21715 [Rhodothermales bacterium]